jgi:hypothetical protein
MSVDRLALRDDLAQDGGERASLAGTEHGEHRGECLIHQRPRLVEPADTRGGQLHPAPAAVAGIGPPGGEPLPLQLVELS